MKCFFLSCSPFQVFAKIEAELTCFDAQMKFAQPEAKKKAKEKMLQKTLMWWAAREEKDIPLGEVDLYAWNVFQILREEPMKLPKTEKDPTTEYVFWYLVRVILSGFAFV